MRKMKDSGIEWIGEIPEDGRTEKIKFLKSEDKNSFVDGPFGSNLKSEHYIEDGEVFVIESNFATRGLIEEQNLKTISKNHFETIRRSECRYGDIIISKIGEYFGKSNILPLLSKPSVVSGNSLKLTISNLHNVKYIWYSLVAAKNIGTIDFLVNGTGQPALSLGVLNEVKLQVPIDRKKENKIADYLDKKCTEIDSVIMAKENTNGMLKEYRQSVIHYAVTKGLNKNAPMKDSGIEWIGEIPDEWEVKKIKYFCDIDKERLNEITTKDFLFNYIDISSVTDTGGIGETVEMEFENSPSRARMIVKEGDTIVSTVRTYLRAIAYVDLSNKYICSTGFCVITPKNTIQRYMYYLCMSEYFIRKIVSQSVGVSYPAINSIEISNIK
ncbi:MAG: restriction endonuclease subunit S, partial [Sedimentibacter sp.]